ncbi:unnamed protein product [Periconia digitata]|uniref:Uncharacterized protein n=1 Tax=Periconia digitata TaxID=1303443 RepID=A0A9W4XS10_9PLEO|nr:unnamed protein product [Periconia digitata]
MLLQRRYSVTGQTPPNDVGPIKSQPSPKLQALDTNVQTGTCGLCGSGSKVEDDGKPQAAASALDSVLVYGEQAHKWRTTPPIEGAAAEESYFEGHNCPKTSHQCTGRTSSKRSATQLPSPNTPFNQALPTKIARLGLNYTDMNIDVDEDCMTDPFPEESDWALSSVDRFCSASPSLAVSPISPPSSVSDELAMEPLRLTIPSDVASEDFALSPPVAQSFKPEPPAILDHHVHVTLLTLPAEIRHDVYLRLPGLVVSHPLIYCLSTYANNLQHPLAAVNRLLRSEVLAVFYSYNTWIIKLEYKMMYEAFQDWIIRVGDGAASLRLVTVALRGRLFKPSTSHVPSAIGMNGQFLNGGHPLPQPFQGQVVMSNATPILQVEEYSPPDGDASFRIDLSEKFPGGRVELVRCDGTKEAGEEARVYLAKMVARLWEKRSMGTLNGQDWINMVDDFLAFVGWF